MSVHHAILGASGTGKSRVMKQFSIPAHRRAGQKVAVLDPLQMPGWNADFQTDDPERFLHVAMHSRSCVLVIDEWPHLMEFFPWKVWRQLIWCYTIGRNFGHLAYALGQTPKWIPRPVMRQCGNGLIFRLEPADAADVAYTMGEPRLAECATFEDGTAWMLRNGILQKIEVFKPKVIRFPCQEKKSNAIPVRNASGRAMEPAARRGNPAGA